VYNAATVIAAVVLIHADRLRIPETAEALLELDEVNEVYSVAGDYDLVAIVRVRQYEQMADVVPRKLSRVPGIVRTTTLMAFQCYSRRDLERMWSIGLDEESAMGEAPSTG
jgi:DNA-binding Lrp family transcriptional regulator